MQRINWLDCWKGIGIFTVVLGHIMEPIHKYLFWFHMPLFFFISGYLYRDKYDNLIFFQKKAASLLLPYSSFLLIFSTIYPLFYSQTIAPNNWKRYIFNQAYGGELLRGWFGVFWFITCLFFTQQLYQFIFKRLKENDQHMLKVMICFYALAMMNYWFFQFKFLLAINVVALAIVFYWLGHLFARKSIKIDLLVVITAMVFFATILIADIFGLINFNFDMKYTKYGIIGLNIALPLAGIVIMQQLAKAIQSTFIGKVFAYLGKISMVVMYVHQPVQLSLRDFVGSNELMRLVVAIGISCIVYEVISRSYFARKILLGESGRSFETQKIQG